MSSKWIASDTTLLLLVLVLLLRCHPNKDSVIFFDDARITLPDRASLDHPSKNREIRKMSRWWSTSFTRRDASTAEHSSGNTSTRHGGG